MTELEGATTCDDLAREVRDLLKTTSSIESSVEYTSRDVIETVIQSAYVLHSGTDATKFSFSSRLREHGVVTEFSNGRIVRQLRAIANWRICLYLTEASRTYHRIFKTILLCVISPGDKKRTVHAEIQLLLYHESSDQCVRPSIIPARKRPCLLCYSFMRAYGLYQVLQTHGEIFRKWYVPERNDFPDDTMRHINKALQATALDVKSILASFQAQLHGHDNPGMRAQSVIASEIDKMSTPSLSTIRPEPCQGTQQVFAGTERVEHCAKQWREDGRLLLC